tara:strand:- start:10918 stop:11658 length:741 start_codon:yes stop_codon:yes gene_type:complete
MLKIDNEKQLVAFLKHITNSTIKESAVLERDPYVKDFNIKAKKNKNMFEQEESEEQEPEEDESEEQESPEDESEEQESEEEDMNPAAKKALSLPDYEVNQDVTFEQILTAINLVRAGNSTSRKVTKQEIKDYFERLDKEEKGVLLIYLKELAKIMTGAIEGEEAHDPSDPTTYFDIMVKKDGIPKKAADEDESEEQESEDPQSEKPTGVSPIKKQGDAEDTSPPIKVNESQDKSFLLRKVRKLMKS